MNKEQDKERIEEILNWARENIEIACSCGVCQCEDEMIKAGHECETIKTLRNKLTSLRDEVYEKGFIAGADATGSQAEEVLALKLKEQENEIIKKIATKEVHCELKGYKIGKKEMKKKILELIYGEINKTTKDEKDTRSCECLENIYQKIKELKINSF